jgi:hypothetical protein
MGKMNGDTLDIAQGLPFISPTRHGMKGKCINMLHLCECISMLLVLIWLWE